MIEISDDIVIGYARKGGMLEKLVGQYSQLHKMEKENIML